MKVGESVDLVTIRLFKDWLRRKYGWSYDYFCRICGETRQEEIWNEFFRERETKK